MQGRFQKKLVRRVLVITAILVFFGCLISFPKIVVGQTPLTPTPTTFQPQLPTVPASIALARIDRIEPNQANVGETVTFSGSGTTSVGEIVGFNWGSSIDNFLSSSAEFSTSGLSEGTHTIYFQVQVNLNNELFWSDVVAQTLIINPAVTPTPPDGSPVPIWIVLILFFIIALLTVIGYYLIYLVRPSLKKIEKDLTKSFEQEAKEELKEDKNIEKNKKKGKPYLKLEINIPRRLLGLKSEEAKGKVLNMGLSPAQDIKISATATPGLILNPNNSEVNFSELQPIQKESFSFPFAASNKIRRGNYKLRFETRSKQTSSRVKNRSLRAIKIGLLSDEGGQKNKNLLTDWFKEREIAWDELTSADNFLKLLGYDLIVIAHESEISPKWVKNISKFVEASQSLLILDRIKTPNMKLISQTLGYSRMTYEDFESDWRSIVTSNNQHEATSALKIGEEIPLKGPFNSICISDIDKEKILAMQTIGRKDEVKPSKTFPAIVANNYGDGRVIYLNFSLEQSVLQNNEILQHLFNWLIFQNTRNLKEMVQDTH